MYYNPVNIINSANWKDECINLQKKIGIIKPIVITSNGNLNRNNLSYLFDIDSL